MTAAGRSFAEANVQEQGEGAERMRDAAGGGGTVRKQGNASLRRRLILATATACGLAFLLAGIAIYFALRSSLVRQFDESLSARAQALAALIEQDGTRIHLELDPSFLPDYSRGQRHNYFELITPDGKPLVKSPSLQQHSLEMPELPLAQHTHQWIELPDGRAARMYALPILPPHDDGSQPLVPGAPLMPAILLVAGDTSHISATLFHFARSLILVCAVATALTALTISFLISRQLQPVRTLAEQISRVGRRDLTERVDPGPAPAELQPVVARLNEMLARVASAFEREKAFTADVAHELRTPISALETALEVSASRIRDPESYRQTLNLCLRTVREMHALVDRLLTLARADARQLSIHLEPVPVAEFLRERWGDLRAKAEGRHIGVEWEVDPRAVILTDPGLLRQVVQNVMENAISYAPEGAQLRVYLRRRGEEQEIHFVNPAPDLSDTQVGRVFDRFWRADKARSSGAHAGLGLALCQKLMGALSGSASVGLDEERAFHLTLTFPGMGELPEGL